MKLTAITILVFVFIGTYAEQMTKCELAKMLLAYRFPREKLRDWVCLVDAESERRNVMRGPNEDGSFGFGLFQIRNNYWCHMENSNGECALNCNRILHGARILEIECVKKIYQRVGFNYWKKWQQNCQKNLPDLSDCNL